MEAKNVNLLARNVGITLSCLCTFLFQTSIATTNHYVLSSIETLVANISQVKNKTSENYASANFKVQSSKVTPKIKQNRVYFAICNDCYWCASCLMGATKIVLCPSCQGSKVRSTLISTGGLH